MNWKNSRNPEEGSQGVYWFYNHRREEISLWETSTRRQRLPANWPALRLSILRRDSFRCQLGLSGCKGVATDVDHKHRGDNHSPENLQAACSSCHIQKTTAEAHDAKRRKKARRFRPAERHPGMR